ncbi:DNA repair protein RecN [Endozoicomonas sp. SCSIO W0465]|uniref:DNA repair protein RecN n=1 Tax=Endozoicomonas sp. SCSIO W0465 TaxID=2918516 RepID=UPI0020756B02|nr:DNA repair protein RecN [Endozoicomonas sp. SCSIO W0465]USE37922.1 DNA repair protein RecN [Endozoicomonas sp. SCSIO W0465]
MLNQISISNYAIVDHLNLDINPGMTAITGETGAGKSIMLDALGLALGGRADSDCVRDGADRADIRACFDLQRIPAARDWLLERDYEGSSSSRTETLASECILRRVITREGRSRGYINGIPVTLSELKGLGELLIDIHSQHAHQSLLKKSNHSALLDEFAGSLGLSREVAGIAAKYRQTREQLLTLLSDQQDREERVQLLSYQLNELEQLGLQPGEVGELEQEHRQQSQAGATLSACHQVTQVCTSDDGDNLLQQLTFCLHRLGELQIEHAAINNSLEMLSSAQIQVEEAVGELNHFIDHFDADPQRARDIEDRLSAIFDLARKHRVQPESLLEKQQQISEELEKAQCHDGQVADLELSLEHLQEKHNQLADKLSAKRKTAARKLEKQVSERIALLGMPKGKFCVELTNIPDRMIASQGYESIEFLVTTNPGQSPRPLGKVASGGELSRISLAIQVIIAQTASTPTLVFDEVDVGIGGGTAEIVGSMLREVGNSGQVLCVTHQPQVASQAHQHLHVSKKVSRKTSSTRILKLDGEHRVHEIARMLGGIELTAPTLSHAQEMLFQAQLQAL